MRTKKLTDDEFAQEKNIEKIYILNEKRHIVGEQRSAAC